MPELIKVFGLLGIPTFLYGWLTDKLGFTGSYDDIKDLITYIGGGIMSAIWFVFKMDRWRHDYFIRKEERRRIRNSRRSGRM